MIAPVNSLFCGQVVINSDALDYVTVSTPLVQSGDLVFLGAQISVASNQDRMVVVNSIVDGVSFALHVDRVPLVGGVTVNWMILKTR